MDKKVIVITGPIGSGKSKVLSIINRLGYNTVDLDVVSAVSYTHLRAHET